MYAIGGARSALDRACRDLPKRLELRCDGEVVHLPETTASIIILNINSFAGGSKLWAVQEREKLVKRGKQYPKQRYSWRARSGKKVQDVRQAPGGQVPDQDSGGRDYTGDGVDEGDGGGAPSKGAVSKVRVERVGGAKRAEGSSRGGRKHGGVRDGPSGGVGGRAVRGPWRVPSPGGSGFKDPSFKDGMLEVVAVEGVLQLGSIQLGLSKAKSITQCREVEVRTFADLPMQVDGEPWKQPPSEITVKLHKQAPMLRKPTDDERAAAEIVSQANLLFKNIVDQAEKRGDIKPSQARMLTRDLGRLHHIPWDTSSSP
ncbi:unnamed protein product [Discosporangium mesarthrocarpum]